MWIRIGKNIFHFGFLPLNTTSRLISRSRSFRCPARIFFCRKWRVFKATSEWDAFQLNLCWKTPVLVINSFSLTYTHAARCAVCGIAVSVHIFFCFKIMSVVNVDCKSYQRQEGNNSADAHSYLQGFFIISLLFIFAFCNLFLYFF
jgi:hypothetical protein